MSERLPYFLGCPVWISPEWKGSVYRSRSPRSQWLKEYSAAFATVEGNSTFYSLPSPDIARRWAAETEPGFRFALKFPQVISHERRLADAGPETRAFLQILEILKEGDRLGPSFLQLPPTFDATEFAKLRVYLKALPMDFPYAVEVRHRDYFDSAGTEASLNCLLTELGIDRVLFDSRALYSAPPVTAAETLSQTRKPRSPFRRTVTGRSPLVRIVGRDNIEASLPWLAEWSGIVAGWIREGLEPYVFMHAPNDAFAPGLAEAFHQLLREHLPDIPPLPTWPGRAEQAAPRQQMLF